MLQCVHNGRFLFRRALWHFGIFLLRQMIVLANLQPALPLNLGDMQGRYLQASMLQYIRFDLVIDDFALRRSQIQLISIQLHLDMLLSIEFGQQAHRLNMRIIVQTQAHIFRNDWELEFDGLEPLTVGLPFLIDLDFG